MFLRLQRVLGSTQRIWGWRGGCLEESPWVMLICKTDHKKRGPSWGARGSSLRTSWAAGKAFEHLEAKASERELHP